MWGGEILGGVLRDQILKMGYRGVWGVEAFGAAGSELVYGGGGAYSSIVEVCGVGRCWGGF